MAKLVAVCLEKHREALTWLASIIILFIFLRGPLFYGATVLSHDNYYWSFPLFHYFSNSIANFTFPFWNPYSHTGEPFYFLPTQLRLLEPLLYTVVVFAKLLHMDIVQAFAWNRVLGSLLMAYGTFICLRLYTEQTITRLLLIPMLVLSSFMFSSFRQDGIYCQFMWAPFIYWFYQKIFDQKDNRLANWLGLGAVIGINWSSYFFAGTWTFLMILSCGFLLFNRTPMLAVLRSKATIKNAFACGIVILAMMAPNLAMMLDGKDLVYPARMLSSTRVHSRLGAPQENEGKSSDTVSPIAMDYELVESTGTFFSAWDFITSIYMRGNPFLQFSTAIQAGEASEAFFYIGILGWSIGLIGMVYGRHRLKKLWLLIFVSYGLLGLGPMGGLLRLLFFVFPPLWYMRHFHALSLFFHFAFLYFFALGMDFLLALDLKKIGRRLPAPLVFAGQIGIFAAGVAFFLRNITLGIDGSAVIFLGALCFISLCTLLCYRAFAHAAFIVPGILLGQIFIIVLDLDRKQEFLSELLFLGALPLALTFMLVRVFPRISPRMALAPVIVALLVNLLLCARWSNMLYDFIPSPRTIASKYDTNFTKPRPPLPRAVVPVFITPVLAGPGNFQDVRYPEVIERQPYAFSNLDTKEKVPTIPSNSVDFFKLALKARRWNTFILPKEYFWLLNSGIDSAILHSMFAIGEPLFSYRESLVYVPRDSWVDYFKEAGVAKSVQLLSRSALTDQDPSITSAPIVNSLSEANFGFEYVDFGPNTVELKTRAGRSGFLYWADSYNKYWEAQIDGKPTPIFRVNKNFKAIALPAGEHQFRFVFNPVPFKIALWLYYGAFFLAMAFALELQRSPRLIFTRVQKTLITFLR